MRRIEEVNKDLPEDSPLLDFRNFLYLVWEFLGLPEPTDIQYDVANAMWENATQPLNERKCIIQAPRGLGKSFVCGSYAVWRLLLNKDEKILVPCGNEAKAKEFTTFCNRIIYGMDLLAHLRDKTGRSSTMSFDVKGCSVAQAPSMKAAGIMGSITGSRATIIIADDVETPNSVETQGAREKLNERVKEFGDIVVPETQEIICLGTPQSEDTVYDKLSERGYALNVWTAEKISPEENDSLYYGRVKPFCIAKNESEVGEPTEPTRFSKQVLEVKKIEHGRTRYQQQFMLCPRLLDQDKYPLKLSDLIVTDLDPLRAHQMYTWTSRSDHALKDVENVGFSGDRYYEPFDCAGGLVEYTGSVMSIDPSGRGADETSYAVVYMLNGYQFVMDAGGIKGGYDVSTLEKLAYIAQQWKVNQIVIESNFGDSMFNELFKPVLGRIHDCSIEEIRHHTNKEMRIADTLEPVMNSHKLIINKKLINRDYDSLKIYPTETAINYSLLYQMSRLTREKGCLKHDDRLDALAIAVNYWREHMAQDVKKAMAIRKQRAIEDELRDFHNHAFGVTKSNKPTFYSLR